MNKQLAYEADRDSSKQYLKKAHEKFIPSQSQMDQDADKTEDAPTQVAGHYAGEEMGTLPQQQSGAEPELPPTGSLIRTQ